MSLIKFFHSAIKTISLIFLSLTHSFNHLNFISFTLIIIRDEQKMNTSTNLYIILYFIIYDIIKFFTNNMTLRVNRLIGEHVYYSISICILSVMNLIFSFISFSYSNIYIFILYRIYISLFNNISLYIDLPISLLYSRRQFYYKKRNFSFFQKIHTPFFFLVFLLFFNYFKKLYIFCFFLAILNLLCFIISLVILGCNREKIYTQYYPTIPEKDIISGNYSTQKKLRTKNNIKLINEENKKVMNNNNKNNLNNTDNNDITVNVENNNSNNININTSIINNTDNLIKSKQVENMDINNNKNNLNHNNTIKIEEQNETRNFNPSQTLRGLLFPFLFSDNNINPNLYPDKIKIIIKLLALFTITKCLYFISLFMLIFKVYKIKIYSFIDQNNNELLFSSFSLSLKIKSITEEYLFLFMSYYFFNIIFYFINMSYTSIALKKNFLNILFYYLSLIIFLISSIFFIYYYLQSADNTEIAIEKIRKNIILCFVFNFMMNECNMIMSIFYNIIGKKKGFGERMLKDIKSLSTFFAGILFLLIQSLVIIINLKNKEYIFEKYFYYAFFGFFSGIIFLIGIFI